MLNKKKIITTNHQQTTQEEMFESVCFFLFEVIDGQIVDYSETVHFLLKKNAAALQ